MKALEKLLLSKWVHVAMLFAAVTYVYHRTLSSYFLADDFGEIHYVWLILEGDWGRFWSNFTGNYMQLPVMAVYRPWLLVTLLVDFALWGTRAFGFYLTNLTHFFACGCLMYFLIRSLTGYWGEVRSKLAALFSALLFVVSPLHAESVSWVVGRVDVVCLTYFLASLLAVSFYLSDRRPRWIAAALLCFAVSIGTKEMAIGLPVVATLLAFLFGRGSSSEIRSRPEDESLPGDPGGCGPEQQQPQADVLQSTGSRSEHGTGPLALVSKSSVALAESKGALEPAGLTLKDRFRNSIPVLVPFAIATVVYFVVRILALGTITGGYIGSIGKNQLSNIFVKWADPGSIYRIFYPLNWTMFGEAHELRAILFILYVALISIAVTRLLLGNWPRRWLLLLAAWLVVSLVPIYQLYGLGWDLEGSRFLFFATCPLSMVLPLLLFAPLARSSPNRLLERRIGVAAIFCLALLSATYAKIAYKNNVAWVHAGNQARAVGREAVSLARRTGDEQSVALMGIPKRTAGAHIILNAPTMGPILSRPFCSQDLYHRIQTFDAMFFGGQDRVNTFALKSYLSKGKTAGFYKWNFERRRFEAFQPAVDKTSVPPVDISLLNAGAVETDGPVLMPFTNTRGRFFATPSASGVQAAGATSGLGLVISELDLAPFSYDYLEVVLKGEQSDYLNRRRAKISWLGTAEEGINFDNKRILTTPYLQAVPVSKSAHRYRIPLSCYWKWFSEGRIKSLYLELPAVESIAIDSVRVIPHELVGPTLSVRGIKSTSAGSHILGPGMQCVLESTISENASSVLIEIGKVNFFFENLRGDQLDPKQFISREMRADRSSPRFEIVRGDIPGAGYCEIRARWLDADGVPFGEYSFPVTIELLN